MAAKPETTFTLSVHRHLPPKGLLHREKMNNPYHSGTADVWYSGPVKDLWIEYKFVQLPARAATRVAVDCSELQFEWLRGRHRDGRSVWVIVGCKAGGSSCVTLPGKRAGLAPTSRNYCCRARRSLGRSITLWGRMNLQPLFTTSRVITAVYRIISTTLLLAYLVKRQRARTPRRTDHRNKVLFGEDRD